MWQWLKILSLSSSLPLSAKTITHPAARSLCDRWASCCDVPQHTKVGGVGMYVKNCFIVSICDTLKLHSINNVKVENIRLEVHRDNCKYAVGGVYIHPNNSMNEFCTVLDQTLYLVNSSETPYVIADDFNIDISKYAVRSYTTDYVNMLLTNNFIPVCVMPTRITNNTATIIDHIYYFSGSNCKKNLSLTSGNLWCDITDHLPNFITLSSTSSHG